jgi:hypothetical protein
MDSERRARFIAWFKDVYGEPDSAEARKKFMADSAGSGDLAFTKGRVSQLFSDQHPFGEKAARNIAERFGLGEDFFLREPLGKTGDPTHTAESQTMADLRDIERINPEMYAKLVAQLHQIAAGARASDKILRPLSKKGYVRPERAHEKLGHAPPPVGESEPSLDRNTSGFDQLLDLPIQTRGAPAPKPRRR